MSRAPLKEISDVTSPSTQEIEQFVQAITAAFPAIPDHLDKAKAAESFGTTIIAAHQGVGSSTGEIILPSFACILIHTAPLITVGEECLTQVVTFAK